MALEPFLGEIMQFAGNYPPRGWAFCNGQLMSIAQNTALFSLLGTTYGGDGQTTFGLPNLQSRVPLHAGQGPGLSHRDLGEFGGAENVTLLQVEMAIHSHAPAASNAAGTETSPANAFWAQSSSRDRQYLPGTGTPNEQMANVMGPAGGGQPHNNMAPYLAISYCIALEGIYPARP